MNLRELDEFPYRLGILTVTKPGQYEVLLGNRSGDWAVRRIADAPIDQQEDFTLSHPPHDCDVCPCCDTCMLCEIEDGAPGELCWRCERYVRWLPQAKRTLSSYAAHINRPNGESEWFAQTKTRTHTPLCPILGRLLDAITKDVTKGCNHKWYKTGPGIPMLDELPEIMHKSQISHRKPCGTCKPEVVLPPPGRKPHKGPDGRFTNRT